MRKYRSYFENLFAEVVARLVIGAAVGGFVAFQILPELAQYWHEGGGLELLLIPLVTGALAAVFVMRKGPGLI